MMETAEELKQREKELDDILERAAIEAPYQVPVLKKEKDRVIRKRKIAEAIEADETNK